MTSTQIAAYIFFAFPVGMQNLKTGDFTIGINELFDGIAKVSEQFAEELAEQRLQEKTCLH